MKKSTLILALVVAVVVVGAVALQAIVVQEHEMLGKCLLYDDIAYSDPAFGTFVHLVFKPIGSSQTITFVAADITGAEPFCTNPFPMVQKLTFRVEPTVSEVNSNSVILYALEALEIAAASPPGP